MKEIQTNHFFAAENIDDVASYELQEFMTVCESEMKNATEDNMTKAMINALIRYWSLELGSKEKAKEYLKTLF